MGLGLLGISLLGLGLGLLGLGLLGLGLLGLRLLGLRLLGLRLLGLRLLGLKEVLLGLVVVWSRYGGVQRVFWRQQHLHLSLQTSHLSQRLIGSPRRPLTVMQVTSCRLLGNRGDDGGTSEILVSACLCPLVMVGCCHSNWSGLHSDGCSSAGLLEETTCRVQVSDLQTGSLT